MLSRPVTRLAAVIAVTAALLWAAPSALADDGLVKVDCHRSATPGCTATASSSYVSSGNTQAGGGSGCRDAADNPAPCVDANLGWMGSDGCYYKQTSGDTQGLAALGPAAPGPGAWYMQTCVGSTTGLGLGQLVWVPGSAPVPPVVVARQAASQLALDSPRIATSPPTGTEQLVRLPTWLWIDPASWQAQHATASVPGVSVTANATPTTVTWTLGDGTTLTCRGPGTAYSAGADPAAASPDCGHTYMRSSADQPGGAFAVTATVTWGITWAGGGQTGALPALQTQAITTLRVVESRTVIVANGS
jgi:hypothetical protein